MIRLFKQKDLHDLVQLSKEQAVPVYTDQYDEDYHWDYAEKIITACNEWKRKNYGYGFWENDELKGYLFGSASQPFAWSGQKEATVHHWYSSPNSNIGMKLLKHFEQYAKETLLADYIVVGINNPLLIKELSDNLLDRKGYELYRKDYRKKVV